MKKTTKRTLLDRNNNIIEQSINVKYFNEHSKLTLEIEELPDGRENWRKVFEYKDFQETETLIVSDVIKQTNQIKRNNSGHKLEETTINNSNNQIIYSWSFDQPMSLITVQEYSIEGELILKTSKHLNSKGEIIKEIEEDDYQTNYKYVDGNVSNVQIIDNGELVLNEDYYYDKNGNEIRSIGIDKEEGGAIEVKKIYNVNNKIIKEEQLLNGELEFIKQFEYNSNQQLVRIESKNVSEGETELTEIDHQLNTASNA